MSKISSSSIHPIVRMDYPLRVIGQFFVLVAVSSGSTSRTPNLWFWSGLLLTSLAWPHLAFRLGSAAEDGRRAELRNLLGDSAIVGWWIGHLSFALWPSTAFVSGAMMSNLAVGGVRQGVRSLGVMVGAAVTRWVLSGVRFEPASDLRTAAISLTIILLFTAFLGFQTYERTRRLVYSRNALERQRDQISSKNIELEEARQVADAANQAKSSFLANMNHEFHTPIHAILGYAELVSEEVQAHNIAAIDRDLGRIKSSAEHLLSIVDSVLDFTRIEGGRIQLQLHAVDIEELCGKVETNLRRKFEANENTLEVRVEETARWARADRLRLEQILIELLSNATNFTHRGTIGLEVSRVENKVAFVISDSGQGIPPDKLGEIFEPFSQADESTTRRVGGTGLGLALCRELCRLMGGELWVTSELGEGSRFGFSLAEAESPVAVDAGAESESEVSGGISTQPELAPGEGVGTVASAGVATPGDSVEIPTSRKHDLLTPVNHIIGYGELLAEDAADAEQQDLLSGLERVCACGRVLEKIITFQFESAKKAGTGVDAAGFHGEMDPVLSELGLLADGLLGQVAEEAEIEEDLGKIKTAIENLSRLTHDESV